MMILSSCGAPTTSVCDTIRQPSLPIFAKVQYRRFSERIAPDFFDGCLPVLRWLAAVLQAMFADWAAAHDFVLYREREEMAPSDAFGLRTESIDVCTKLHMEHC